MSSFDDDPRSWRQQTTRAPRKNGEPWTSSYSGVVQVGGVDVFVGVQSMPSRGDQSLAWWGKVEFNPSRVVDPDGVSLAPAQAAAAGGRKAMTAASALLKPDCDWREARVRRIDVARDFQEVSRPAFTIRSLEPVHRPYAKRNLVHSDPARHGAQTLMVGSGSGVVRLYDKAAESGGKAAEGTVRWEAECRQWASRFGEIHVLGDVTAAKVRALAADRWQWSSMGVEVAGGRALIEAVQGSALSPQEQATFLGFCFMQANGGKYLPSSRSLAKWRKVQRDLGLSFAELGDVGRWSVASRLDWESGREVLRAA